MEESKSETDNKAYRHLTPRQLEVLLFLAQGLQNKEIAEQMQKSVSTVKQHVSGMMMRLNVRTRTGVVIKAQKLGLI